MALENSLVIAQEQAQLLEEHLDELAESKFDKLSKKEIAKILYESVIACEDIPQDNKVFIDYNHETEEFYQHQTAGFEVDLIDLVGEFLDTMQQDGDTEFITSIIEIICNYYRDKEATNDKKRI